MLPDPEDLADQVLVATGQRRPPTDIRKILAKWSELSVIETELDGDGFFVDLGKIGGEIFVKRNKSERRKRFTLAHELGHFIVRHHIRDTVQSQQIESWCNQFASELLLPKEMVNQYLQSGGVRKLTERLIEGPGVFNVSEQAFYLRISRLLPISIFSVLVSSSLVSILDVHFSEKLNEYIGDHKSLWNPQLGALITELVDTNADEQHYLQQFDRTLLAKAVYRKFDVQKFLLVLMRR